jgi:hypothetical protein
MSWTVLTGLALLKDKLRGLLGMNFAELWQFEHGGTLQSWIMFGKEIMDRIFIPYLAKLLS